MPLLDCENSRQCSFVNRTLVLVEDDLDLFRDVDLSHRGSGDDSPVPIFASDTNGGIAESRAPRLSISSRLRALQKNIRGRISLPTAIDRKHRVFSVTPATESRVGGAGVGRKRRNSSISRIPTACEIDHLDVEMPKSKMKKLSSRLFPFGDKLSSFCGEMQLASSLKTMRISSTDTPKTGGHLVRLQKWSNRGSRLFAKTIARRHSDNQSYERLHPIDEQRDDRGH